MLLPLCGSQSLNSEQAKIISNFLDTLALALVSKCLKALAFVRNKVALLLYGSQILDFEQTKIISNFLDILALIGSLGQ